MDFWHDGLNPGFLGRPGPLWLRQFTEPPYISTFDKFLSTRDRFIDHGGRVGQRRTTSLCGRWMVRRRVWECFRAFKRFVDAISFTLSLSYFWMVPSLVICFSTGKAKVRHFPHLQRTSAYIIHTGQFSAIRKRIPQSVQEQQVQWHATRRLVQNVHSIFLIKSIFFHSQALINEEKSELFLTVCLFRRKTTGLSTCSFSFLFCGAFYATHFLFHIFVCRTWA